MGHTVGDAAKAAVTRSERKADVKLTPEQLIQALRNNLRAGLWVPSHQIDALLQQYDLAHAAALSNAAKIVEQALALSALQSHVQKLEADVEQFRSVYEQENRSTSVTVEAIPATVLAPAMPVAVAHEVDRFHDDGGPAVSE